MPPRITRRHLLAAATVTGALGLAALPENAARPSVSRAARAASLEAMTTTTTTTRPFIPYVAGAFLTSPAAGAPIDEARTTQMHAFMSTFGDQRSWKFPKIQGVAGNLWGTVYAEGTSSDPLWHIGAGAMSAAVAEQLKRVGFRAPAGFGSRITGTSDSPFCVMDRTQGITVFGTKAVWKGGTLLDVQSGGCMWHSSNGLDARNPKSTDKRNQTSRGRLSEALVIRRDLMDYAIANGTGLGHVLELFIAESNSNDGHCHPMVGHESGQSGFGSEGERLIIRPEINLAARGMSPAGLALARTLQDHGCYIGDNAGGPSTLKADVESRSHPVWNGLLKPDSLHGISWTDMACVKRGWQ